MQFINRQWRTLVLSSLLVVGTVCTSGSAEKPAVLVGQWVFAEGYRSSEVAEKSIEMFSDGTGVVDGASMTWKVENKRLMMLTSKVGIACDYKVSGNEFILTYDDDKSATFVKKDKLEEYKKKIESDPSRTLIDSRDGQKYRIVNIGGKKWMKQNLNYQAGNSWCYGGDNSKCAEYGRLYDWNTAKTVCPAGWHLPSREEWGALAKFAGGTGEYGDGGKAGTKLKSTSGWSSNGNGTDDFGFSALPGGFRDADGSFVYAGSYGYWWTATGNGSGGAYGRYMNYGYDGVGERDLDVSFGFSVRCVGG